MASDFDYAGTQACRSLKEEGIEVVLLNSNPATIMTDKDIADRVYIEPLTVEVVEQLILKEKPDSVLPTLGGQAGLNLAMELDEKGFLKEHNIRLIGTTAQTIKKAEDRQEFKDTMEKIGEPIAASKVVTTVEDGLAFTNTIGYPVVLRPAYTLGGSGGGIAHNEYELREILENGLRLSRVGEVLVERCIAECKKDMAALNVKPATTHPQATKEIGGMLDMIQTLIDKGHAYVAEDGTVYFRTKSFKEYGKLSHKNIDELQSGFREIKVTGEEGKEDPNDFVLWKPKKEGEPYWESPWCKGRPGWHIECSVMSKRYLGDQIDIHAGGEDLIFPHHENEIAQSECANDKTFANYWMHNGFLNIDNVKMSKSLGNFFTVREITEKYDPQVLRFFMLSAHYRGPLNFSADLMQASKNGLDRILNGVEKLCDLEKKVEAKGMSQEEEAKVAEAKNQIQKFEAAMEDDFNTADAITAIFELVRLSNSTANEAASKEYVTYLKETIEKLCDVLGIITEKKEEVLDEEIEALIQARQQARKEKNFALADEIRGRLSDMGIILEDTREGVKWKRA